MADWVPYQDLILDAIDQLRRRKARPDAERIYNCLFRRKGLGSSESRTALDRCVENGIVLRVSYKGNISYRNAAKKYSRQKRRAALAELGGGGGASVPTGLTASGGTGRPDNKPRRKFTNLLTNTFAELVLQEPDYLQLGIPPAHLIKTILEKDSVRYKKSYLVILLQKEVENGGLVRLENGNFLVGKPPANGARKHHQSVEKDKEQLTRIKREMRNHHVIHRKPFEAAKSAYNALQDEVKTDAEDGEDEEEKEEAMSGGSDAEESREPTPSVHSEESQESRTTAQTEASDASDDVLVAAARQTIPATTTIAPPTVVRRGRGRPPLKRGGVLVARSRITSKRERLGMEGINSLRVGGRRKKAKKVFDPSESNMPKKRGRPLGSTKSNGYKKLVPNPEETSRSETRATQNARLMEGGVCSVCHVQNKRGPTEKMISCRECSNKAHASCLNGDDMMLKMYPDNSWQCPHCKTCVVCFETSDAGNLVVCSVCADAYHNACHSPKVNDKIKSTTKWLCNNCKVADETAVDNFKTGCSIEATATNDAMNDETPENTAQSPDLSGNSTPHSQPVSTPSSPTLPTLSPQLNHNGIDSGLGSDSKWDIGGMKNEVDDDEDEEMDTIDENIDPSIPDASNWTPDEVAQYFAEYFPQEARVFKEQEIDGHSLLLMRRMDVLKGLDLKLGPALKIYRHVLRLQYRRDDRKLYWV